MRVTLFDKRVDRYHIIENVESIDGGYSKINGRFVSIWRIFRKDGYSEVFKKKDFAIEHVELM